MTTTTMIEVQKSATLGRMQAAQADMDLFKRLQGAETLYEQERETYARLEAQEQDRAVELQEQVIESMSFISVRAGANDDGSSRLSVPVTVTYFQAGRLMEKPLHQLERIEEAALIRKAWDKVPAWIKARGATPEKALEKYGRDKRRGYSSD